VALEVEVVGPEVPAQLREDWDRLLTARASLPAGHDPTSGPAWFESLCAAFDIGARTRIVVLRNGGLVGVQPVVCDAGRSGWRRLSAPTTLYGGRNGMLLDGSDPERLNAMLSAIGRAFGAWQSMHMLIVDGSDTAASIASACARYGYRVVEDELGPSPYFPLYDDAQTFAASMSKGLKQTLRTAANKLSSIGALDIVEVNADSDLRWAIDSILAIERSSWKHEAGTAITRQPQQERFYRELFPRAARAGLLCGQVALLGGRPVAYNFGLIHAGVYCCLKHSQTLEHEASSPGQLLMAGMISSLRARGVKAFDFMGKVEPHKLRWSSEHRQYTRRQVWIYAPSASGRLGYALHVAKRGVRDLLARRRARASSAEDGAPHQ
jgi:CelD/BcsL family acetyltransferase involved in cellulose biosynthesis